MGVVAGKVRKSFETGRFVKIRVHDEAQGIIQNVVNPFCTTIHLRNIAWLAV